ncbi:MAG: ATP-dependent helicase [Bacteroidales bacterium]|nr:ATP-dependent helicase [Bacteroidales bacterium]
MCKIKLSPKQQEIAALKDGAVLVRASAGSGKTRVLVERIKMLAGITKRKVLAITFTNKACEEIRTRLAEVDENLLEHVFVVTFHGLCESIIENHIAATRFETMPQIFTDDDRKKILEETITEIPSLTQWYKGLNDKERKEKLYRALDNISLIKRSVIPDNELGGFIRDEQMHNLYLSYREHMDSLNAIDFDDLLLNAYLLLINNPRIADLYRRSFTYICVDEAQDLNKAQYMVLRAITGGEHKNVMLVGDTKQSIYAFNGSSSEYMDDWFVRDYHPTEYDLNENYRSAKSILDYAQKVVYDDSLDVTLPYTGVCEECAYDTPCEEAKGVVDKIKSLVGTEIEGCDEKLNYTDIAVLARNKFVLGKIEEQLKSCGLPYHYKTTGNGQGFISTAAKAFDLAMVVRANPYDRLHLDMLQSLVGTSNCESLQQVTDSIQDIFLKAVVQHALLLKDDCSNMLHSIKEVLKILKTSSANQFKSEDEALATFDEFELLMHHWNLYAKSVINYSLSAFRNAMSLGQTSAVYAEGEGITLSTIHTMKGQQAVVVFLIGMDDGTFPDYRSIRKGSESLEMQQEKNNLYVAVTRAQRYLYISYPKKRNMPWGDWSIRKKSSLLPNQ